MRVLTLTTAALVTACATGTGEAPPGDTVSVPYDPYRFEMTALERAGAAQCAAKGFARAEVLADQPNTESVRWSYLTFGCYR